MHQKIIELLMVLATSGAGINGKEPPFFKTIPAKVRKIHHFVYHFSALHFFVKLV
jgi:hypothetical protein